MKTFTQILQSSFALYSSHFKIIITLSFLLSFIPTILFQWSNFSTNDDPLSWKVSIILLTISFSVLSSLSGVLLMITLLQIYDGNNKSKKKRKSEVTLQEAFANAAPFIIPTILLAIVQTFALIFLFLLLIIPGIIFAVYWSFSYLALVLDKKDIFESLSCSKSLVRGRWWKILGYLLLLALLMVVCSGVFFIPMGILSFVLSLFSIHLGFFLWPLVQPLVGMFVGPFFLAFFYLFYKELKSSNK